MSNRRYIIYNKSFSEYVYRVLTELPADVKSEMSSEDHKLLSSSAKLTTFVNNAPMEHLLLMLTKVGKTWDLRVYDLPEDVDQLEFSVVNQYQFSQKRVDVTERMAKDNIFYLSASNVMLSAMMANQNCHSRVYQLASHSRELSKRVRAVASSDRSYEDQIQEVSEGYDNLNKIVLQHLNSFDFIKETLGLEQNDYRVLSAFFLKRNTAMHFKEIGEITQMSASPVYLKKIIGRLADKRLIIGDKNSGAKIQTAKGAHAGKRVYYLITAAGIRKVMEYNNHIHQLAFK